MQSYVFSAKENAFFPLSLKTSYQQSGRWPDDGKSIENNIADEFMREPPEGKVRVTGSDGYPAWVDAPPPTQEELIAAAEQQKTTLLLEGQAKISLWQTELQLGIISDEDKASLIAWMSYIKAVQAVDTSTAPDINWPEKPEA